MTRTLAAPQARCRFGVARGDITPPAGIYHRMWGAAAHDRATGVHRPLTATAMVFQPIQGKSESAASGTSDLQVVVALDHCLLWHAEMQSLLAAVEQSAGVPRACVTFAFSHTHAAGLMDLSRAKLPGGELIAPYLDFLAHTVSRLIVAALQSSQPAWITLAQGRCSLAAHRDFWDLDSRQFVCGFNPGQPADDTLLLLRASDDEGRVLATILNYACHPTTLAWENTLISPDFVGAAREVVEQATGAPCAFLQGASGDLGPREGFVGDVSVADRNGRQLGFAALAAWESLPPPGTRFEYAGPVFSGATLGTWRHSPLDPAEVEAASVWQVDRFTVPLPLRPGLPSLEETRRQSAEWREREAAQRAAGDPAAAESRAMVERIDRRMIRLQGLRQPLTLSLSPEDGGEGTGDNTFDLPVVLWRTGDIAWLAVEGEPYSCLQVELRRRLAPRPVVVMALANGSRPSYLPPRDLYGQGIYQESIAVLEAGSLERLIDEIGRRLECMWV